MAKRKLIALIGKPASREAALQAVRDLDPEAAIVTRDVTAFDAAAELGRFRTLERHRDDDAVAKDADLVIVLDLAEQVKQSPKPAAAASKRAPSDGSADKD